MKVQITVMPPLREVWDLVKHLMDPVVVRRAGSDLEKMKTRRRRRGSALVN
jgi:hypothetical protein